MKTVVPPEAVSRLKAQMFHLLLTVFASGAAMMVLHAKLQFMFLMVTVGWATSLFIFALERPPYWRIAVAVLGPLALFSVYYRFALSPFFG
jgi:hypothetical protein